MSSRRRFYALGSASDARHLRHFDIAHAFAGIEIRSELCRLFVQAAHGIGVGVAGFDVVVLKGGLRRIGELCPAVRAAVIHAVQLGSLHRVPTDGDALFIALELKIRRVDKGMGYAGSERAQERVTRVVDTAHGISIGGAGRNVGIDIGGFGGIRHPRPAVSAAIIDDIIGIVVLTFVLSMKDPSSKISVVSLKVVGFLAASLILGIVIYKIFKVWDEKYPHTRRIPIVALSLCFVLAYVAEEFFGIADITGAYIAGIILCNVRDADYIDRKVSVNGYMFFAPIFFVCIGLKTNFDGINSEIILFSLAFVAVAMLAKLIGCGLAAKCFKFKTIDCIKIGAGMMTRGEVALIITNKGLSMGVIPADYSTAVILLIIVSSIVTPIFLKFLYSKSPDPTETEPVAAEAK